MYTIIGADQQQYGPVSLDEVRKWIAERRANGKTLVRKEGETEWKPLASFPEFAEFLETERIPPSLTDAGRVQEMASAVLQSNVGIDPSRCIVRSWNLLKENFWLFVGATFLIGFLWLGASLFIYSWMGWQFRWGGHLGFGPHWRHNGIFGLWTMVLGGPFLGGLNLLYLKRIRGQPAGIGDAFDGFKQMTVQLILGYILIGFLTYVGLFFCILPGIYLSVAWLFTIPLIIDKRLGFWEAMELSRKVVHRNWWSVFALSLLASLIAVAGLFACCIGIVATAPIAIGALMYAYEDLFGARPAKAS